VEAAVIIRLSCPWKAGGTYDFTVYWGDGESSIVTAYNDPDAAHTYSSSGTYTVLIEGTIRGFCFNNTGDRLKLLEIEDWGPFAFGNAGSYFRGAENLRITATDSPDLTGATIMVAAFQNCSSLTTVPGMGSWDMSNVENLYFMFEDATLFNEDIGGWDTSSATNMQSMFNTNSVFNQDISTWNTSSVTNMERIFLNASTFNQNLGSWDVSQVTTMAYMLTGTALTTTNYSSALIGWASLPSLQSGVSLDADASYSSTAASARNTLTSTYGWAIYDGGLE